MILATRACGIGLETPAQLAARQRRLSGAGAACRQTRAAEAGAGGRSRRTPGDASQAAGCTHGTHHRAKACSPAAAAAGTRTGRNHGVGRSGQAGGPSRHSPEEAAGTRAAEGPSGRTHHGRSHRHWEGHHELFGQKKGG